MSMPPLSRSPMSSSLPRLRDMAARPKNNFDFLRFWLASLVLFYHSLPVYYGVGHMPHGTLDRLAVFGGTTAVDGFFVISGFLILNSWERAPQAGRYLLKRVLRIYPGWLALALVTAAVFGPLAHGDHAAYRHAFHAARFAKNALLLAGPDIPPTFTALPLAGVVNASAWTLRYEFACYLGLLALGLLGALRFRGALLVLYVALCAANLLQATGLRILAPAHEYPILGNPVSWLRLAPDFLAGMLAYSYQDSIRCSLAAALAAGAGCVALAFVAPGLAHAAAPVLTAYFLLVVAFTPVPRLADWARQGDFSYGIYLYAFPIQQLVMLSLRHRGWFGVGWLTAISYAATLLAAVLSWHLVERPCLRLKGVGRQPQMHPPILDEPAAAGQ